MKIVVLAGGNSPERDVSLNSGAMIYQALKKRGHAVVLLDVYLGYEGDIASVFDLDKDWAANIGAIKETSPDPRQIKSISGKDKKSFFGTNVIDICRMADIVFIALHGENGEDGRIQAAFDLMGIQYTGTGFIGSVLAMDKSLTKEIFANYNIPFPAGIHVKKEEAFTWETFPCVVKTCCGGSSIGVSIVYSTNEMDTALRESFIYGDKAIIEEYVQGREFSVGVLDGKALPVIEIAPLNSFYDYKNKYQPGAAIETCPAQLEQSLAEKMQQIAETVFSALRLETYARMDFILNQKNEIYCLEANTLPGMTPTSLIPQEALADGLDFGALCERIIHISLKKY